MENEAKKVFNVSECVSDRSGVVVFVRKDGKYYCSDSFHEALKEIFNTRATVEYIDHDNDFKTVRVDASVDADKKVITLHIPAEFGSNDKALRLTYTIENEITAEEVSDGGSGGSGGQFIVNIHVDWANSTDGRFSTTCDKTPAEISAAIMSGIVPVGHVHMDSGINVVNYSYYLLGDHDEIAEVVFIKSMFDPRVNGEEVQSINVAFDKISIGSDGHGYYEYSYGTIPVTAN